MSIPPNTTPFLEVFLTPDDRVGTKITPFTNMTTIHVGMALASATRVATEVFLKEMNLSDSHREQIEAQIAEVYNNDLKMGDMGERESTEGIGDISW